MADLFFKRSLNFVRHKVATNFCAGCIGSDAKCAYPCPLVTDSPPANEISDRRVTKRPAISSRPTGRNAMRHLACILGVGPSAASRPGVAENAHFGRDVGEAYVVPGVTLVRFATRHTGRRTPVRHFALDGTTRGLQGQGSIAGRRHYRLCAAALALGVPASSRYGITSTEEKNDGQMVSAAMDRQVRAYVEL
jgi:hypothetical protein